MLLLFFTYSELNLFTSPKLDRKIAIVLVFTRLCCINVKAFSKLKEHKGLKVNPSLALASYFRCLKGWMKTLFAPHWNSSCSESMKLQTENHKTGKHTQKIRGIRRQCLTYQHAYVTQNLQCVPCKGWLHTSYGYRGELQTWWSSKPCRNSCLRLLVCRTLCLWIHKRKFTVPLITSAVTASRPCPQLPSFRSVKWIMWFHSGYCSCHVRYGL